MPKNTPVLHGVSPWIQDIISSNLSWNRPFDWYVNNRISAVLKEQETQDNLMKDAARLLLEGTQDKHNYENWLINKKEYEEKIRILTQKLELIKIQMNLSTV